MPAQTDAERRALAQHMPRKDAQRVANQAAHKLPAKRLADARAAIQAFVDGNAHRLEGWLDAIANGKANSPKVQERTGQAWAVPPNPVKAFELFTSVVEYHVPKLARTEVTGPGGGAVTVEVLSLAVNATLKQPQATPDILEIDV